MFFKNRAVNSAKKMQEVLTHLSSIQPWQDAVIKNVLRFLNNKVKHLLSEEKTIVPSRNLFIIPRESLAKHGYGSMWIGGYMPKANLIVLSNQLASNQFALVHGVIHETTHFMAEKEWQKNFWHLEEGVTCEITRRTQKQYVQQMSEESRRVLRKNLIHAIRETGIIIPIEDVAYVSGNLVCPYTYRSEHILTLDLCTAIKKRFPKKFSTEAEAFGVFEEAHFTGETHFLEHLLDCTFGKRVFRFLSEINQKAKGHMGDIICAHIAEKLHLPSRHFLQTRVVTMLTKIT